MTHTASARIGDSILDTIGDTPLVRLSRIGAGLRPQLAGEGRALERRGSIKDSVAIVMIEVVQPHGLLKLRWHDRRAEPPADGHRPGDCCGDLKADKVIVATPDKMLREKIDLTARRRAPRRPGRRPTCRRPPPAPTTGRRPAARRDPGLSAEPVRQRGQPPAHYQPTGPDLWEQTAGQIIHLVIGVGTGGTVTGAARYLRERPLTWSSSASIPRARSTPVGEETVRPYLVEGVGEGLLARRPRPRIVDRWVTASDSEAFLTNLPAGPAEAILAGGRAGWWCTPCCGRRRDRRPGAMVVVILPDGGRSYLSKIFSDAWMRQYGFLERDSNLTVGDVLRRKSEAREFPTLVTVQPHFKVREAVALLHEHRVSQLPVVSAHDPAAVVGAIGERGLLKHAAQDPSLLDAEITEVWSRPSPLYPARTPPRGRRAPRR